uniref:Poly (ADP-ribose) polymerase family, member 12b n=1 Tax=Neogobius melanostomus TaxID=47308 RepID=A0A8C6V016_9GOBI
MSYSTEVMLITKALCAAGGAMRLSQLYRSQSTIAEQTFHFIVENCPRFALLPGPSQDGLKEDECTVVARTSLRLCQKYLSDNCAGCQDLHLCRYYVYGNCKFTPGRIECRYSHNIHSDHNSPLLRECTLCDLSQDQLFLLLLQNDQALLPEVCSHYNKGLQQHGICSFRETCTKVHLCLHFVQGLCFFGRKCIRQHSIDETGRCMLMERGLSDGLITKLPIIYQNSHRLKLAAAGDSPSSSHSDGICTGDICLHFLRNSCRFQETCELVHFHLPYRWQIFNDGSWLDLQQMEQIEEDYCDPSNCQSFDLEPVSFITMTRGSQPVRRLSTISSVKRPLHYTLTTKWLWYYKQEQGKWVQYGEPDDKNRTTSVTSKDLEEAYLSNKTEVVLVKGHREYTLTFTDMYQRNNKNNTKRKVLRRPRYVSPTEVRRLRSIH